jgi:phosphate transport system protein
MTFRPLFDEKIAEIRSDILRMGGIAGDMVRLATDAAINGDIGLANEVVRMDDTVDTLEKDLIRRTVMAVAMETPVGGDLRLLVATLGITGEIEKVADDAVKLARRATKLTGHFPGELKKALVEISEQVRKTFGGALRLYSEYDPQLAAEIINSDEYIDGQYVSARTRLFELIRQRPSDTEHLVRTIDAFHALEHVADHAVEIARRIRMHNQAA